MITLEDKYYKLQDYLSRSQDSYTLTKYKIVMKWLPKQKNIRVLNAGCGSGEMNILLAQNASWQVDALDVDRDAIYLSQKIQQENNLDNLQVFHNSIEEHQPSGKYDIIVSNDVLEHIENDIGAMEKLYDMLEPNGILCISVPALPWLFGYHDEKLGHYRRYTRKNLLKKLSRYFQVKKCRYFGAILIPIVLLYSCWLRKPYPVGQMGKASLIKRILDFLLNLEAKTKLPIGISLLVLAIKKSP